MPYPTVFVWKIVEHCLVKKNLHLKRRERERQSERETERETDRETERETARERDRETETDRKTERETARERERERARGGGGGRCHYIKSNPIDDHSNISWKKLQKQNFKPLGNYSYVQCGTSHLQTVQENILSHIILATYRKFTVATVTLHKMSVAILTPTPYINKWQISLCNNSSANKSYWIHRGNVKVSAQVTTVTYMHQSQPSLHLLRINLTVYLELWPGNHLIWCNAT